MLSRHVLCLGVVLCLGCGNRSGTEGEPSPPASAADGAGPAVAQPDARTAESSPIAPEVRQRIALARDAGAKGRERAILELGELAENDPATAAAVVQVLKDLLDDPVPGVRVAAVGAAGEIGDARRYRARDLQAAGHPILTAPELLPRLVQSLGDPDRGVRESVPRTLGKIAETNLPAAERLVSEISPLLDSDHPGTRAAAAEAVRHIADRMKPAWRTLKQSPAESDQAVAGKISELFKPVVARLEQMREDADAEAQREAEGALDAIAAYSNA